LTQATAPQITVARQLYTDDITTFQACNLVERTIIQQINTALDEDCLAHLINDNTGLLVGTIPQILQSLFDTYRAITPQSLATAKAKVEASTYNHARPIVNIFTAINEYANMANAAQAAKTPTQLINIGIIIINRSTIFSSDIHKWHDKQEIDKTWPNFKDHFKAAQKAIKRSQPAITTNSLGFHEQANATENITDQPTAASIVTQVLNRISTQRNDASVITAESIAEQQMQQQIFHMANSTQQNQQMLEQMTALATTVATLQTQVNSHNQSQGQGGGRPRGSGHGRAQDRNGRGGRGGTCRVFKYCWTHRNDCSHGSADCEAPTDGHLKCATYSNMQGGSTYCCHWLNS
jgi:hypothetical protein